MRALIVVCLLACFLNGCAEAPTPHKFIIVVFDQTGSMPKDDLEAGKSYTVKYIAPALTEGDKLGIGAITSSSFGYRIEVISLPVSKVYLDLGNDKVITAIKDSITARIAVIRICDYSRTDIYGQIASVAQIFLEDTLSEKYLIIISDMEDNVARENIMDNVSLKGVRVYVFYASHKFRNIPDDVLAWQAKQEYWHGLFHKIGAANTFICDGNLSGFKMDWLSSKMSAP